MKLTRLTIREYAESLAVAFVLAMIIRHFAVEAFRRPTSSMEPTLIGREGGSMLPLLLSLGWCLIVVAVVVSLLERLRGAARFGVCTLAGCVALGGVLFILTRPGDQGGDRILVSKFQFDLHPPRQWDVVVFKIDQARIDFYRNGGHAQSANGTISHPGSAEYVNYVKRLIGLPGHTLQVRNGDIFIDGRISRKPDRVQDVLLVPVYADWMLSEAESPDQRERQIADFWMDYGNEAVKFLPGGVVQLGGTKTTSECDVRFRGAIVDRVTTDQKDAKRDFLNVVGDLKLAFRFRHTGGAGYLVARLAKNGLTYVFYLPMGKRMERPVLSFGGSEVARGIKPFDSEGEHRVEVSNVDARAVLKVDGETLISYDNDTPSEVIADQVPWLDSAQQSSSAEFGASLCDVEVRDLRLWRDVYYTAGDPRRQSPEFGVQRPIVLGPGEYFMMGDNSPNSFDSRNWGVVEQSALIGEAFFVFWPVPHWKFIN